MAIVFPWGAVVAAGIAANNMRRRNEEDRRKREEDRRKREEEQLREKEQEAEKRGNNSCN